MDLKEDIKLKKQINLTILSETNRHLFCLSPHVEYRTEQNRVLFYNSLFDSMLPLSLNTNDSADLFVDELRNGVENIQAFLTTYFPTNNDEVYKLLVHKKIIE